MALLVHEYTTSSSTYLLTASSVLTPFVGGGGGGCWVYIPYLRAKPSLNVIIWAQVKMSKWESKQELHFCVCTM